jgi:uncharacterized lipoprotein YddW (UPF0748 family)
MIKKLLFISLLFAAVSFPQQNQLRATWITNVDSYVLFTDKGIADAMDYLASINVNLVFPVVWNAGYTLYPSQIMDSLFQKKIHPSFNGRDPLKRVILEAHRNGIEVIPWFEYGFAASYSLNGGHLIAKFPHWAAKDGAGNLLKKNGFEWMSGLNPEVQDFMISLMTEVMDNYDADGIQGDDRLPAMPVEGGYDSTTVAIYRSEHSGNNPPAAIHDAAWKKWRANKLTSFLSRLRDSVKTRSEDLILSITPSPYPWGYDEYLQDSKIWLDSLLLDNFIPQLYRTDSLAYLYELGKALSYVPASQKDKFFAGVLARSGSYVISPALLLSSVRGNRNKGVNGESFFFYEGLRANNNLIGDTLRSAYYQNPAQLPYRGSNIWRPKAEITNEDDSLAYLSGSWVRQNMNGFKPFVYWCGDTINYSSVDYYFDVPAEAWYEVYTYLIPYFALSANAHYTTYSINDSNSVTINQRLTQNSGWTKIGDVFLSEGRQRVMKLDNKYLESGKNILADASMLMINRKLSPDAVVLSTKKDEEQSVPASFILNQNYPNPFNPSTRISFNLDAGDDVKLIIYDILGREVAEIVNGYLSSGFHSYTFSGETLSSGVYFYMISSGSKHSVKKMVLIK